MTITPLNIFEDTKKQNLPNQVLRWGIPFCSSQDTEKSQGYLYSADNFL
jgi:hypothetical protein